MYLVDSADEVIELSDLPAHSAGAPMPMILATDNDLRLAYEAAPDGNNLAVVSFIRPEAHYFGSLNDEALQGHPLAARGLGAYGIYEVRESSWIRTLAQRNSVHRHHDAGRFDALKHFIFTFHDTTFECVAGQVQVAAYVPNEGNVLALLTKSLSR